MGNQKIEICVFLLFFPNILLGFWFLPVSDVVTVFLNLLSMYNNLVKLNQILKFTNNGVVPHVSIGEMMPLQHYNLAGIRCP
ncbi:hypothetical protein VNO78_11685 [Psophocarpus tetragonolobus]|uniref:Uncharacterized protein n=1 Tax=Psophocarpus tetragonolobus TaxID=3891 RepID=A0AAN9XP82_PSOTE